MNLKTCKHKPKRLGYIAWHYWAERMAKSGYRQKQCPICRKWFFDCEMQEDFEKEELK